MPVTIGNITDGVVFMGMSYWGASFLSHGSWGRIGQGSNSDEHSVIIKFPPDA